MGRISDFDDLVQSCEGNLIGDMVALMRRECTSYYPECAMGTAIFVLGAVAQRAFVFPRGHTHGHHFIVGASNCGKNDYLDFARRLIDEVDHRLILADPTSGKNLKAGLSAFPSRCWIADEAGGLLREGCDPKSRVEHAKTLLNLFLSLWGGMSVLPASGGQEAETRTPRTPLPRWSVLGSTTTQGVKYLYEKCPSYGEAGHMSRNVIWEVCKTRRSKYKHKPVQKGDFAQIGARLKSIFKAGMIFNGMRLRPQEEGGTEVDWPEEPTEAIEWGDEGALAYFCRQWDAIGASADSTALAGEDIVESVAGRARSKALTYSLIHCIASDRRAITMEDAIFGCKLASVMLQRELARLHAKLPGEDIREQVLAWLKKKPLGSAHRMSDVQKHCRKMAHMDEDGRKKFLRHMADDGLIILERGRQINSLYVRLENEHELGDTRNESLGIEALIQ